MEARGYLVEFDPCTSFVQADLDHDCDVDDDDFALFKACATRSGAPYDPQNLPPECVLIPDSNGKIAPDFNKDGDVDADDFGALQRCHSGSGHLPNSNCAN